MSIFAILRSTLTPVLLLVLASAADAQISPELAQKAPHASAIVATAEQQGYVRIIVQFAGPGLPSRPTLDAAAFASIKTQIASTQGAIIASHFGSATNPTPGAGFQRGLQLFDITPMFAVNVSKAELDALAADPRVTVITPDKLNRPTLIQSVPLVGMTTGYSLGATGAGQAVAVIDTGVQSNHEFLAGKVVMEACFSNSGGSGGGISLCPNGLSSQTGTGAANATTAQCVSGSTNICDHGTHVSGIAAGNNTNPGGGKPANGVAKSAVIVAVQVFTRFNTQTDCGGPPPCVGAFDSDLISALNWLLQNALTPATGVSLAATNMSLGGGLFTAACDSDPLKPGIDNLRSAGVASAVASGNDGKTNSISSPGCISSAIAVGATDKQDVISSYSNMSSLVALMAPGGFGGGSCVLGANNADILSSVAGTTSSSNAVYDCFAGTSMATPHVAGAIAAIRSVCHTATVSHMLTALQNTGIAIADTRSGGSVTKPRIRVDLALLQTCRSNIATHDVSGEGRSDIAWQDTLGNTSIWLMNGAQVSSSPGFGLVPPVWSIVAQRDFDGDGYADLLWRDNTGNTAMWFMNGATVKSGVPVGNIDPSFSVIGTGDFDGDGHGDIIWRDSAGNTSVWLMKGVSVLQAAGLGNLPVATWTLAGTGDFDGDGKTDLLWRDTAGNTSIWFMNGVHVGSSAPVGNIDPIWSVVGIGDFNGDGKSDIVWRDMSGNTSIWLMSSASVMSAGGLGTIATNWSIVLTGDYNGDGMSDLLWRDVTSGPTSGNTSIWFMNGTAVASTAPVGNIPIVWTVQSLNAE